ncbi:hypothetical protein D3C79_786230 [compost metagenome]
MQFQRRNVVGFADIHNFIAALGTHGLPQRDLGIYRQPCAEVGAGHFAAEFKELPRFYREVATVIVAVVIVTHAAKNKRHGIALVIQVHMPGMPLSSQLPHGLHAVTEVTSKGVGVFRGDIDSAYGGMVTQFMRGNRADQVTLHPQQFPVEEDVALAECFQGLLETLLPDPLF